MVASSLGGALNRLKAWEKTGDTKMLYHAVRFLWISHDIIRYKKLRLPVSENVKRILIKSKTNPEFGIKVYNELDKNINLFKERLPLPNSTLANQMILGCYD